MTDNIIVNKNTGEVIGEIREGDRILRRESLEYLSGERHKYKVDKNAGFVKIFLDSIDRLTECGLSKYATDVCLKMLRYIRYDSGILAYNNGGIVKQSDLPRILNISQSNVSRAICELKNKDIIASVERDNKILFLVNPYIFMRGMKINCTLYDTFSKSQWKIEGLFEREN